MCKAVAKNSPGPPYSPLYKWKWTAKVGQQQFDQHTCIFCEQVKALKLLKTILQSLLIPLCTSGNDLPMLVKNSRTMTEELTAVRQTQDNDKKQHCLDWIGFTIGYWCCHRSDGEQITIPLDWLHIQLIINAKRITMFLDSSHSWQIRWPCHWVSR